METYSFGDWVVYDPGYKGGARARRNARGSEDAKIWRKRGNDD